MEKALVPILLTVGGLGVAYTLFRRFLAPAPSPVRLAPGLEPSPAEGGVSYKSGSFNVFVPFAGVGDFVKGLFDGGTKDQKTEEKDTPSLGLQISPAPADYRIAPTPAYGRYSGLGIGSRG